MRLLLINPWFTSPSCLVARAHAITRMESLPPELVIRITEFMPSHDKALDQAYREAGKKGRYDAYCKMENSKLQEASTYVNLMQVCKGWNMVINSVENLWHRLWKMCSPGRSLPDGTVSHKYRTRVYCEVRDWQLCTAIKNYIKDEKLVYRTPAQNRKYPTDKLGMRKLIRLGKQKLFSQKRKHFDELAQEWTRVHKNGIKLGEIDRRRLRDSS